MNALLSRNGQVISAMIQPGRRHRAPGHDELPDRALVTVRQGRGNLRRPARLTGWLEITSFNGHVIAYPAGEIVHDLGGCLD